jgi:hypothetical protein
MQELADKVWANPRFHDAARQFELSCLRKEFGSADTDLLTNDGSRLIRAAAILACSQSQEHRRAAFRAATCAYELFGCADIPLDQALRVVLARLGNFPSFGTRADVASALPDLPLSLAAEEIAAGESRSVTINRETVFLTDFQHSLWNSLQRKERIALAAPTSAGKSFVLQGHISTLFTSSQKRSVAYIVPTRALIAQVADDLALLFKGFEGVIPSIVTVPVEGDTELPGRAIYVMTQERIQLSLQSRADFAPSVVIVDEAHSIAEQSRGVLLQWVVDDLIARNQQIQILFASPTIRNLEVFGNLFGLDDVVPFSSIEPTVAQNFLVTSVESATSGELLIQTAGDGSRELAEVARLKVGHTIASRTDKLVHISAALGAGHSNIVYANGAAEAETVALQLAELLADREETPARFALSELAKESVHTNYALAECVKVGVAFHYSNIPTQLRRAIEMAVAAGDVDFLVCTSTLLQGVNLPAKNIFMFAPEKGRTHPLESTDFWNLAGRAGRLRKEFQGNIFLIDYEKWKKKPLEGPRDSVVVPALETSIKDNEQELLNVIGDAEAGRRADAPALESAFVRLFSDLKGGTLSRTLERAGLPETTPQAISLANALATASENVSLPAQVFRQTPNISAHKQQRLFNHISDKIQSGGVDAARALMPKHPRESDAYQSYAEVLELCHDIILGIDTSRNLHRFQALIALRWMLGWPLPQIIDGQIARSPSTSTRTTIRKTLDLIEGQIRFQAVRLFGCYNSLLIHALDSMELSNMTSGIPSLPLFLEIGASDRTMISFISLGLSRVAAMKLNELSARKDLDQDAALSWLKTRQLEALGLSPLLQLEVRSIMEK